MKGPSHYRTVLYNPVSCKEESHLRSNDCAGTAVSDDICQSCLNVSRNLKRRNARRRKGIVAKKTPLKDVSKRRLKFALRTLRTEHKKLKTQKVEPVPIEIQDPAHDSLMEVLETAETKQLPPLAKVFWEEQKRNMFRPSTGKRWNPAMIRIAIMMHSQSPQVYRTLRNTGLLQLPGETTLRDYTNAASPSQGFQPEVFMMFLQLVGNLYNASWHLNPQLPLRVSLRDITVLHSFRQIS